MTGFARHLTGNVFIGPRVTEMGRCRSGRTQRPERCACPQDLPTL